MGIGFLVDRVLFPSAAVVHSGSYFTWVRLPGADCDFYICAAYAPKRKQLHERVLNIEEDSSIIFIIVKTTDDLNARGDIC